MVNELIQALQNPKAYDHPVNKVTIIETHISWVILTGDFAYKIKKPIDFGFLDFSTLEKRQFYCQEELRLNQRLAPAIYLAIVPISGPITHPKINASENVIEYAVKMRQFPQESRLDQLLEHQKLKPLHIDILAETIANFHAAIPSANLANNFGSADNVIAPMLQNFEQMLPMISNADDKKTLLGLRDWTRKEFVHLRMLLDDRKKMGHIKECHGDLHLANIALINNQITIFDCIEFNESFRWIDTINEIAFLVMDLEDKKQFAFAARLLNRYLEITGDFQGIALLDYYKVYRAMVRAKVALLQWQQSSSAEIKTELMTNFQNYLKLAQIYVQQKPTYLLVTHGVSGTGKTTISTLLIEELGMIRLRSDIERKRLFGLDALEASKSVLSEGIYQASATHQTYQRLVDTAKFLLIHGHSVTIDATCLLHAQRILFRLLAEELKIPIIYISCQAPIRIIEARIRQRLALKKDASEADLNVLAKQLSDREPLSDDEVEQTIFVDTHSEKSINSLVQEIQQTLEKKLARLDARQKVIS